MTQREFKAAPAIRKSTPLLVGVAGPPGAGKTFSLLRMATGIKAHRGGPIIFIDTERNRALRYAPPDGKQADGVNSFDFMHISFDPPFKPSDFLEAVRQQRQHRPSCIIIDSCSDEHEGEGGVLDWHDAELNRMAGEDWAKRERMSQAAWIKPKRDRLEMMGGIMQLMTPVLFGFRAREKTKQIANDRGKMVPTNIGWTPIAPSEIIHAMDLFALLPIKSDGVPMWKGNTAYEDFTIKLPRQFAGLFPEGQQINEEMGRAMSVWALGDVKPGKPAEGNQAPTAPGEQATQPKASGTKQTEKEQPKEPERPQPATAVENPEETAAAEHASDASMGTEAGTSATGGDTSGDDFPGDRPADDEPDSRPSLTAFETYASVVAGALLWKPIQEALGELMRTDEWKAAAPEKQAAARRIAFVRWDELRKATPKTLDVKDFLDNLHLYRSYIEAENDPDVLTGNQAAIASTAMWKDAGQAAQAAFLKRIDARLIELRASPAAAEQFA
jgi:hypothetical protein